METLLEGGRPASRRFLARLGEKHRGRLQPCLASPLLAPRRTAMFGWRGLRHAQTGTADHGLPAAVCVPATQTPPPGASQATSRRPPLAHLESLLRDVWCLQFGYRLCANRFGGRKGVWRDLNPPGLLTTGLRANCVPPSE